MPSEMSDLQSKLLFRRDEHSAVGLCTFSLTQRNLNHLFVAGSPPVDDFGTTPKHSTGLSWRQSSLLTGDALGLNLIRIRLSSHSPEKRAQQKRIYLLTCLPLPMCLTGSEPGHHVLQRACLWNTYKNCTVNQVME